MRYISNPKCYLPNSPGAASFGGIFGLCVGGSMISLIEFIYYFTFGIFNVTRAKREQSSSTLDKSSMASNTTLENVVQDHRANMRKKLAFQTPSVRHNFDARNGRLYGAYMN